MPTPGISGLDTRGRLVAFINEQLVHVPISGVLTLENLEDLGFAVPTVDALDAVAANTSVVIPAGWAIDNIFIENTTANAVQIKIGTTSGAQDVALIDVAPNALMDTFQSLDWILFKRLFSTSSDQTIFIQSLAWNSASLNIRIKRTKVF